MKTTSSTVLRASRSLPACQARCRGRNTNSTLKTFAGLVLAGASAGLAAAELPSALDAAGPLQALAPAQQHGFGRLRPAGGVQFQCPGGT